MLQYLITSKAPATHVFHVSINIDHPDPDGQILSLPAWIKGSYMIRDFSKNIMAIKASSDSQPVKMEALDKQTWRCEPVATSLLIEYDVYAWDLSVRSAHLDQTHGYFNGTSVFLKVLGQEKEHCSVTIQKPQGHQCNTWAVASTLSPLDRDEAGFGRYTAKDYDDLVDHPVEMGSFLTSNFELENTPHEMIFTGQFKADLGLIAKDVKAICAEHITLFGHLPKMSKYQFQTLVEGDAYGGLEHKTSTSLICKRTDLVRGNGQEISDGYRQFLGLCSHEYFHLWNVKRIQPLVFQQSDLSEEVHTRLLWAFEGITSYYDDLALLRSQRISSQSYLELLAQTMTRVKRGAGRLVQTLEESSFYTWNKFYKQDENAPNAIVSYYAKGALVALLLDLTIRFDSQGRLSLDDVMRFLWQNFGIHEIGVPEDGIEKAVAQVTGRDYRDFFDLTLRSCEELPLATMLEHFGIGCRYRPALNVEDKGGKPDAMIEPVYSLGLQSKITTHGMTINQVLDGGAAQLAGLSAGDRVIAMNQLSLTKEVVNACLVEQDDPIHCHVFRRDVLFETTLIPQKTPNNTCDLWLMDTTDKAVLERRKDWLKR